MEHRWYMPSGHPTKARINNNRAFVFAIHRSHGLLLLSAFKQEKGCELLFLSSSTRFPYSDIFFAAFFLFFLWAVHMQLPGGRMERTDIVPLHEQKSYQVTGACQELRVSHTSRLVRPWEYTHQYRYYALSLQGIFWGDGYPPDPGQTNSRWFVVYPCMHLKHTRRVTLLLLHCTLLHSKLRQCTSWFEKPEIFYCRCVCKDLNRERECAWLWYHHTWSQSRVAKLVCASNDKTAILLRLPITAIVTELTDADGAPKSKSEENQLNGMTTVAKDKPSTKSNFHINLSSEHQGFMFTKDLGLAVRQLTKHSGGYNSQALQHHVAAKLKTCFAPLFGPIWRSIDPGVSSTGSTALNLISPLTISVYDPNPGSTIISLLFKTTDSYFIWLR